MTGTHEGPKLYYAIAHIAKQSFQKMDKDRKTYIRTTQENAGVIFCILLYLTEG